ncbi:hypothetical protein NQ318_003029 [Aromia moschata]|uniref:Charged multivesicular body protein 6 n=1 Tax=Aromia moschata TaxID=1265417 RepID=A0AAV8YQJ2_9CUCU|nr:hypothetical protein NQ318_003029 [Aromia moschata]
MGIIFGKKKAPSRVTEQDKAILQLKQQRDKLKQYQKKIEAALNKDRELAKILLNKGQKDRAKLLLRKKRYQELLLIKTDSQLINLEKLTHNIEFALVELQVIEGLKQGNEALKKVNETLKIEDIESILDETRESIDKQNEINELLSGRLTDEDEEEVEKELADIISEQLPEVPTENPAGNIEIPKESLSDKEKNKEENTRKAKEPVALEA